MRKLKRKRRKRLLIIHVTHVFITPVSTHVISLSEPEETTGETRCSLAIKIQQRKNGGISMTANLHL